MECWEYSKECSDRAEIEQLQLERLQSTLNRVYKNVRHYRKTFLDIDFMPEDFRTLADLKKLPFITRRDLMRNYPYGMFAVPLREVVRLHAPVLNPDDPVVMGFTRNDLKNWADLMARNLTAAGLDKDDVIQVAPTFGIMTGSFGVQMGAGRIGASVIPLGGGRLPAQVRIMRDFRTTALVATPTFALGILRSLEAMALDPKDLSLKCGIIGSEPWSEADRAELETRLHITATDTYSLAEIFGPGVAWECPEKNGLHMAEDHFIPEIIDPETLEPLPPGSEGELVITTISKEAFPLIRFRTGDITRITYDPCACGRTHCRISRIFRRCDEAFVMRGSRIVPEQVGRVLTRMTGGQPYFQMVVEREGGQDCLTVLVEISDCIFFDEMRKQRRFVEQLHRAVAESLGWEAALKLVEPGTFDRNQKITDRRNLV
ncbi:phenylacetate--CoA ligase [Desulfonema ishimotonii]|uniref:Phenylacetate-coenzyme A ligase n=1 Tax=Desulfonema ishimotonii TaxID=45657 RepID=A0A401FXJ0_9BACT|nr:phenylacetate--CoA ligase [Desulfonema ishimotonii]GBC61675.1 phenylacetate--CoA ligase [Desulfonema ishimotonii]